MDTVNWRDGFPGAGPDFAFRAYSELVGTFALIKLRKYDPGDVRKCLVGHKKQFAAQKVFEAGGSHREISTKKTRFFC